MRELGEIHATDDELDQATNFLHSNGILIHYTDSELSDLYFVDPQWLCSTLADIITIRERNPHVKDGMKICKKFIPKILHIIVKMVLHSKLPCKSGVKCNLSVFILY